MAKVLNNSTNISNASVSKEDWKADRFLNLSLPTKTGGSFQIGALTLKLDKSANHSKLIEWLDKDPANVEKLLKKLIITYVDATKASAEIDLD